MPLLAGTRIVLDPTPPAHFGAGAVDAVAGIVRGTGCRAAVIVTDQGLAGTAVVARRRGRAGGERYPGDGVQRRPRQPHHRRPRGRGGHGGGAGRPRRPPGRGGGGRWLLHRRGQGIAVAAVNPERGRDLDYRRTFAVPALPLVAVPTTAGTGTETNAFGVITDPATRRKFYVGDATSRPAAAILDPELTASLPPGGTAATGMDALVHALESCMSRRANPWSEGIALQAIRMISAHLPRAVADGADLEARSQMLLASHLAGIAMASTGLGICHAIGHALGGRFDIAHGLALTMVLPGVLRFNLPACRERLAAVAFAVGAGDTARGAGWNADAAIDAVAALADRIGMTHRLPDFGITAADFGGVAADALEDEVLDNTPRQPASADIRAILTGALDGAGRAAVAAPPTRPRGAAPDGG